MTMPNLLPSPRKQESRLFFYDLPRKDLEDFLETQGFAKCHSVSMFKKFYRGSSGDQLPTMLPKELSCDNPLGLATELCVKQVSTAVSKYDQSVKFVVGLEDGLEIETVLMPEKDRMTLCVSTQVGCAQGCVFCHTGRMGLKRNLSAAEIIGQFLLARDFLPGQQISNIVFMGMGEPLDNLDELIKALNIFMDPFGLGIAPRRITVSTAGHLDGIKRLLKEVPQVGLALSLHEANLAQRTKLMPINRVYPLNEVLDFLSLKFTNTTKKFMIQYTLMGGVNDSLEKAKELAEILKNGPVKINLIPYNPISVSLFRSPEHENLRAFSQLLKAKGYSVSIRFSKGQDIQSGCGQLIRT